MQLSDFDFTLPSDLIALRPVVPRHSSRLLVVGEDSFEDCHFSDLSHYLCPKDVLVFNDTRVIPAQLTGTRLPRSPNDNPATITATLHRCLSEYHWRAFVKGSKKLKDGDIVNFTNSDSSTHILSCSVMGSPRDGEVEFSFTPADSIDFFESLSRVGSVPLPPYISSKRAGDTDDITDYQTIYARHDGAIAAPTAGLHFTPSIFSDLDSLGISRYFLTLHVGAGTFLPVKTPDISSHKMHSEFGTLSQSVADSLNSAKSEGGRIICVGTTCLRLLESAADTTGTLHSFNGETDIFITPGYRFKAVDGLITNFHLPCSTLFMLVCAFSGLPRMRDAYAHAISSGYRFYSYGDSSLLFRHDSNSSKIV